VFGAKHTSAGQKKCSTMQYHNDMIKPSQYSLFLGLWNILVVQIQTLCNEELLEENNNILLPPCGKASSGAIPMDYISKFLVKKKQFVGSEIN
jgi:hypothetical protein